MSDVIVAKAPHEVFLDAQQLADRWPVPITAKGIYRMVNEGRLEEVVTRIGRYRAFRLDRVLQWEAAGGCGLGEDEPK
jgi:hypothetical protein